jgi:hypothetical protein
MLPPDAHKVPAPLEASLLPHGKCADSARVWMLIQSRSLTFGKEHLKARVVMHLQVNELHTGPMGNIDLVQEVARSS